MRHDKVVCNEGEEAHNHNGNWETPLNRLTHSQECLTSIEKQIKSEEERISTHNVWEKTPVFVFVVNNIATISIFLFHLISLESILSIALSVSLTVFVYLRTEENINFDGSVMSWTLLSFAIITPLSASISMAFSRREKALIHIKSINSYLFGIYQAHASWDWGSHPDKGRKKSNVNWLYHSDAVLKEIIGIGDELCRYLTLPTASRARHRVLSISRKAVAHTKNIGQKQLDSLLTRINRISLYCEILKYEGLPGNEAARIRQWERFIVNDVTCLSYIKEYRTPQALRSLCRIFSVVMPPFYAPYYAQLARDLKSLGMGITFSVITALVLTALFESLTQLEDPFVAHLTLDGIDVEKELRDEIFKRLHFQRDHVFFPNNNKVCYHSKTVAFQLDEPKDSPEKKAIMEPIPSYGIHEESSFQK